MIPADCPVKGVAEKIAAAAEKLNNLREAWLNPPEWVEWVITPEEEKAGFPRRPVAKPGHEADVKKRTLTNLYNARPAWLDLAHKELDAAVAEAYGWADYTPDMPDEEILRRLLALNLERSTMVSGEVALPRGDAKEILAEGGMLVRVFQAIDGFKAKFGYWPTTLEFDAETIDFLESEIFTPQGMTKLRSKLTLSIGEANKMIARGKGRDTFDYGSEGWEFLRPEGAMDARTWFGFAPL